MRGLVVLLMVAACSGTGRPLERWTLETTDGPPQVAVRLPTTLLHELPLRTIGFTLRARVPLNDTERGRDLTLAFDCFHGSLSLRVDGAPLIDIGDARVGEHRFLLAAARTAKADVELTASGVRDFNSGPWGIGAAPRLMVGSDVKSGATATTNRALAVTSMIVGLLIGVLFSVLFLLDRRRRADGAFAVGCLATVPMSLYGLGLGPVWLYGASMPVVAVGVLLFVHLDFGLGPIPRWMLIFYPLCSAGFVIGDFSLVVARAVVIGLNVSALPLFAHYFRVLIRQMRGNARRVDAITLFVATALTAVAFTPTNVTILAGVMPLGALHIECIGLIFWMVGITFVLARRYVERHRTLELTSAELQRQVTERSRDLADALGKLARKTAPDMVEERVVDGRYRIVRRLGAGGMGVVYEVERLSDRRRLALKTLRGAAAPEAAARFAREAEIASKVDHPNVVPVLDVGIAEGALFLVMPLVDGGSFEHQRSRFGDAGWAQPYLRQISIGLAALHERKIVHRDLKPANILLDGSVARIADFGLAGMRADPATRSGTPAAGSIGLADTMAEDTGLTSHGDVFGTPKYMAPELADGVYDYSPSSDIFAFGLLACEMLRGRPAFAVPPFLAAQRGNAFAPPDVDGLDPIVVRCLAENPADRPSARDVAVQLGN